MAYEFSRIEKFTSTGTFLIKWGSRGSGDGQFLHPRGVAVDGAGNVYVADAGNDGSGQSFFSFPRIQKFGPTVAPTASISGAVTLQGRTATFPTGVGHNIARVTLTPVELLSA